jgi:hypothetical protein
MASSIPIPLRPAACIAANCGLERPPRFPWQRSGVAPDHSGALPASKLHVASPATSILPIISPHVWVTPTVTRRVTCVFHAPVTFSRQKRPLKPSPRISVRNGFIWPTGDINANYPHIHRGPPVRKTSRRIFVIWHFPFGDRPLGGFLQQFYGVRHRCAVDLPTLQTAIEAL